MKMTNRTILREFTIVLPALFAHIALDEIGIESSVEKEKTRFRKNRIYLLVNNKDAKAAEKILSCKENYEEALIRKLTSSTAKAL